MFFIQSIKPLHVRAGTPPDIPLWKIALPISYWAYWGTWAPWWRPLIILWYSPTSLWKKILREKRSWFFSYLTSCIVASGLRPYPLLTLALIFWPYYLTCCLRRIFNPQIGTTLLLDISSRFSLLFETWALELV